MKIARFDFHTELTTQARLPEWKGSTFRGGFGWALKCAVCVMRGKECRDCLLLLRCVYALTFESNLRKSTDDRTPSPPLPYIIEPPSEKKTAYKSGEPLDFSLILLGETIEMFPYFLYAFELMGEEGLGKKIDGSQAKYRINKVSQDGKIIYEGDSKRLEAFYPQELESLQPTQSLEPMRISVTFETPLRLKRNNELASTLPFEDFVRAILRRISTTFENFSGKEPSLDYKGLVYRGKEVRTVSSNLHWDERQRYSNRQKERMLVGGLIGNVVYEGYIGEYLHLIELCSILHIGKQTTFGHGKFSYLVESLK